MENNNAAQNYYEEDRVVEGTIVKKPFRKKVEEAIKNPWVKTAIVVVGAGLAFVIGKLILDNRMDVADLIEGTVEVTIDD